MTWDYEIPVVESIALSIVEAVSMVSVGNGYHFDLADVIRPGRLPSSFKPVHLLATVQQQDEPTLKEILPGNPPVYEWEETFEIDVYVITPKDDPTPIDEILNTLCADVQKALMQDVQQGGFAYAPDSRLLPPQRWSESQGEFCGITVPIAVTYRVNENDPFTQAR